MRLLCQYQIQQETSGRMDGDKQRSDGVRPPFQLWVKTQDFVPTADGGGEEKHKYVQPPSDQLWWGNINMQRHQSKTYLLWEGDYGCRLRILFWDDRPWSVMFSSKSKQVWRQLHHQNQKVFSVWWLSADRCSSLMRLSLHKHCAMSVSCCPGS